MRRATTAPVTPCASWIRRIPTRACCSDGRLAEDFKLLTGTWVHVGKLRTALVSATGILRMLVIAGSGREYAGALGMARSGGGAARLRRRRRSRRLIGNPAHGGEQILELY